LLELTVRGVVDLGADAQHGTGDSQMGAELCRLIAAQHGEADVTRHGRRPPGSLPGPQDVSSGAPTGRVTDGKHVSDNQRPGVVESVGAHQLSNAHRPEPTPASFVTSLVIAPVQCDAVQLQEPSAPTWDDSCSAFERRASALLDMAKSSATMA